MTENITPFAWAVLLCFVGVPFSLLLMCVVWVWRDNKKNLYGNVEKQPFKPRRITPKENKGRKRMNFRVQPLGVTNKGQHCWVEFIDGSEDTKSKLRSWGLTIGKGLTIIETYSKGELKLRTDDGMIVNIGPINAQLVVVRVMDPHGEWQLDIETAKVLPNSGVHYSK